MPPLHRRPLRAEPLEDRTTPATITVTTLADNISPSADGQVTLREAIVSANANTDVNADVAANRVGAYGADVIQFAAGLTGTIPLVQQLQVTDSLAVNGPGQNLLTVSGQNAVRVFNVTTTGGQVNLNDLTVANGLVTDQNGGGILTDTSMALTRVAVTGNTATTTSGTASGGGIFVLAGQLALDTTTFANNTASGGIGGTSGGAIAFDPAAPLGTRMDTFNGAITFSNNTAGDQGGAIDLQGATIAGQYVFQGNRVLNAAAGGGAISTVNGGLQLQNSTFANNSAPAGGSGGAIFSNGGLGFVNTSTFTGNTAGAGGAVFHNTDVANSRLTFENVTFAGNSASAAGGAVGIDATATAGNTFVPVEFTHATFTGNSAPQGGGLALLPTSGGGAAAGLYNTAVAGNTASTASPDVNGLVASRGNNLIGNTAGTSGLVASDIVNVAAPFGSLAANGGPTQTVALLPGNPALGGGSPAPSPAFSGGFRTGVDQRGRTRPANGPTDIGAFQAQPAVALADSFAAVSGQPLTVPAPGVLVNDAANDLYGPLIAILATPPANGSVALNVNGGFTYTPADGFAGTDTFTYTASNGVRASAPVTVTITVGGAAAPGGRFTAFASGGGAPAVVRVFNADGTFRFEIGAGQLFGAGFTGGARVAVGDLTRDGNDDVVVAAGDGGGPVVLVFDVSGAAPVEVKRFELTKLGGTDMRPGYFVAVGNVKGDATPEIVVTPGSTAGPVVDVVDYATGAESAFMAYDPNFRGGLRVAVGDTDFASDGYAEIVVTPGPSGGPVVSGFKADALQAGGSGAQLIRQFLGLNDPNYRGGAFVAVITVASEGTSGIAVTRDSFPDTAGTFLDAPLPDQAGQLPPQPLGPNDLSRPSSVLGVNLFTLNGSPDMSPPFTFPVLNPSPTGARVAFGVWGGVPGLFVTAGPLNAARTEFYTYDGGVGVIPQVIDVGFGGRPFSVYPGGGAPAL